MTQEDLHRESGSFNLIMISRGLGPEIEPEISPGNITQLGAIATRSSDLATRRRYLLVPPTGVEPAHMASEANALSAELRGRSRQPTGRPSNAHQCPATPTSKVHV
jgi:hypothetical protein